MNIFDSKQAAEILKCSERKVEDLARCGRIYGNKFGDSWIFLEPLFFESIKLIVMEESLARASERTSHEQPHVKVSTVSTLQDLAKRGLDFDEASANDSVARRRGRRPRSA